MYSIVYIFRRILNFSRRATCVSYDSKKNNDYFIPRTYANENQYMYWVWVRSGHEPVPM